MNVTQLALTWVGWPNGEKHACYQLASTCDSVWPGLNTKPVRATFLWSPGQTDSQVMASSGKLNLSKGLRCQTDRQVSSQVHASRKNPFQSRLQFPVFHWLIIRFWTSLNLRSLGLGGQTVKNLFCLACKFDLDQSEHKSSQVNASARKAWPNGAASRPRFSTCVYLRLRLVRSYLNPKHVIQVALKLSSISHTCFFDTTKLYKPHPLLAVFLRLQGHSISARKQHVGSWYQKRFSEISWYQLGEGGGFCNNFLRQKTCKIVARCGHTLSRAHELNVSWHKHSRQPSRHSGFRSLNCVL